MHKTSACLSKFHEKPCYYLLIIYIKIFETIVVLTYVYSENSTGKVFLALLHTCIFSYFAGSQNKFPKKFAVSLAWSKLAH
jgi:hypothetical protein